MPNRKDSPEQIAKNQSMFDNSEDSLDAKNGYLTVGNMASISAEARVNTNKRPKNNNMQKST